MNIWIGNQSAIQGWPCGQSHWVTTIDMNIWIGNQCAVQGWPCGQSHWVTTIDMNIWIGNQSSVQGWSIDPADSPTELPPLIWIYGSAISLQRKADPADSPTELPISKISFSPKVAETSIVDGRTHSGSLYLPRRVLPVRLSFPAAILVQQIYPGCYVCCWSPSLPVQHLPE